MTGLALQPNSSKQAQTEAPAAQLQALLQLTDWVRYSLAGNLRQFRMQTANGEVRTGAGACVYTLACACACIPCVARGACVCTLACACVCACTANVCEVQACVVGPAGRVVGLGSCVPHACRSCCGAGVLRAPCLQGMLWGWGPACPMPAGRVGETWTVNLPCTAGPPAPPPSGAAWL